MNSFEKKSIRRLTISALLSTEALSETLENLNSLLSVYDNDKDFILSILDKYETISGDLVILTEIAQDSLFESIDDDLDEDDFERVYILCPNCGEIFEFDQNALASLFMNVNETEGNFVDCPCCSVAIDINSFEFEFQCEDCGCTLCTNDEDEEECPECGGELFLVDEADEEDDVATEFETPEAFFELYDDLDQGEFCLECDTKACITSNANVCTEC